MKKYTYRTGGYGTAGAPSVLIAYGMDNAEILRHCWEVYQPNLTSPTQPTTTRKDEG